MRQRTPRPIRLATGLIAAAALAMAACGSDGDAGEDGGGDGDEAFCTEIQALAESNEETTEAEDLAALQAVADVAPDEIADEMNQLVDGLEQLQTFDPEAATEEEMTEFLAFTDDLGAAGAAVEEFALENCPDLPADLFAPG
ncbi:MAG: hypothetical protein ACM3MM_10455 [Acidobacteriota bacterium]